MIPTVSHQRAAELHELAAQAHRIASAHHGEVVVAAEPHLALVVRLARVNLPRADALRGLRRAQLEQLRGH